MPLVRKPAAVASPLALVAALLLAGCGSGGDSGDASATASATASGSPSGTPSTDAASPSPAVTPTDDEDTAAADGAALAGEWATTARAIFEANTANLGGANGLRCSGPVRLTLAAGGDLTYDVRARCTLRGRSGTGRLHTTARWSATGDQIQIRGSRSEGTITLDGGVTVPMPTVFENGTATWAIAGDTLTIEFTDPSVGTVAHRFTRL
jgi:hypothetical protein